MKEPIIRLENVWKIYEVGKVKVPALKGISLTINKGEFVSVMGPSGSGKSTCMNMIGALDIPTRGRILLGNDDISKLTESDLAQIRGRKIGFIFQQFNLIPTLTALENVMLPMIFQGMSDEQRIKRAGELLGMVDLQDRVNHRPAELSGGQQQRVAIARSLANDPEIILADEPTGNLDTKTGENVLDFLGRLHREKGKTIVIVTHDNGIAKKSQRIEMLKDGKIVGVRK